MFHQLLKPVGDSLGLSFIVAALPIIVVLVLLGWARRPAWQATLAGLVVGIVVAIGVWQFPVGLALDAVAAGAVFAVWPVMWIVFTAILLYNIAQRSGRFEAFRIWMIDNLPNDRRIVLVVIGFSFGALLEGISGFGTPIAITSSLLILLGFPTLEALTFTLIFNTAPVAFGALGGLAMVLSGTWCNWIVAALCVQLRLVCNLLDGMVAIEGGKSSAAGALYNEFPDRISDSLLLVPMGYAAGWPWLGWLAALLAALTAYVRVFGGALGQQQAFDGIMAKQRRMAALTIGLVAQAVETPAFGTRYALLAAGIVIAVGSLLTCVSRTRSIVRRLAAP